MRTAFIQALNELADNDDRVCLIVGDLGYSVIEDFANRHPDQFVNAGVSEQNMIGLAAGMALSGKIVFTYSIGNFGTLRCLEQIRNDVCYHRANVKVVAVGGGLAYGNLGVTHHASEDVAIMRSLLPPRTTSEDRSYEERPRPAWPATRTARSRSRPDRTSAVEDRRWPGRQ